MKLIQKLQWIFCLIVTLLGGNYGVTYAQNQLGVKSCTQLQNALQSQLDDVRDQNGERCAVVFVTNVPDNRFSFPGVYKTNVGKDKTSGELTYTLYVSPGTRKLTIKHPEYGETVHNFRPPVKTGETWEIVLNKIYLKSAVGGKQFLTIEVSPSNATVEVTPAGATVGDMWTVTNGKASRDVDPGTYKVVVRAPEYYTEYANVEFDGVAPRTEKITLRPNFGYLTINGGDDINGAGIYIDGNPVGMGNLKRVKLTSGTHTLKISKDLYHSHDEQFTITDDQELTLNPRLVADFAETHIKCDDPQAEIYRDGQLLGKGSWKGPLKKGNYLFETRRQYHRPQQRQVQVTSITDPIDITLLAPVPILGSLRLTSEPTGAAIEMDGNKVGVTPYVVNDALVGPHHVRMTIPGYQPAEALVTIEEDKPAAVNLQLSNIGSAEITYGPIYASLYVDDTKVGNDRGSYSFSAPVGSEHTAKLSMYGYKSASKSFRIKPNGVTRVSLNLKEKMFKEKFAYWDMGFAFPSMMGVNVALGGYVNHVNFEGNVNFGVKTTKEFYFGSYYATSYWPVEWGARAGYGLELGTRVMLTPQIGLTAMTMASGDEADAILKSATTLSGVGALRLHIACSHVFGFSLVPEYRFALAGHKGVVKEMSDLDDMIKGLYEGFNAKINLTFSF